MASGKRRDLGDVAEAFMNMLARLLRPWVILPVAFFLGGCVGEQSTPMGADALTAPSGVLADPATLEYRIAPQDSLLISVFQVPDLTRTVVVSGRGTVNLPLIGDVRIAGKTIAQAEGEIATRLGKTYLRSPQVNISVAKSGQKVTVNGAVRTPSVLTVDGRLTLLQAIAQSGGVSDLANSERVHVARTEGTQVKDVVINIEDIQAGKANDPTLYGGDIVVVEESSRKVAFKNVKDLLPFAVIGSVLSDRRVKRNVSLVAQVDGINLYRFQYLWSETVYRGVIAQEVLTTHPSAVIKGADGYLRVNYHALGLEFREWDVSESIVSTETR